MNALRPRCGLGHARKFRHRNGKSVLHSGADLTALLGRVRIVPEAVIPAYVLSGAAARKGDDELGEHTVLRLDGD